MVGVLFAFFFWSVVCCLFVFFLLIVTKERENKVILATETITLETVLSASVILL